MVFVAGESKCLDEETHVTMGFTHRPARKNAGMTRYIFSHEVRYLSPVKFIAASIYTISFHRLSRGIA